MRRCFTLVWLLVAAAGCDPRPLFVGAGAGGSPGGSGGSAGAGSGGTSGRSVVSLTAGLNHTCALLSDGTIYCWGANDSGELGSGSTTASPPGSPKPTQVIGLAGAIGIDAGYAHTCAVLSDGTARCWGANEKGQLGDGTGMPSSKPVVVAGLANAVQISAGAQYSCALLRDGSARCWGYNYQGQLGNGSTTDSRMPTPVSSQVRFTAVAAGNIHTCAIVDDPAHDVVCWGDNMYGQLGAGQKGARGSLQPIPIVGVSNLRSLAAGDTHTCAVLYDTAALCWGGNLSASAPAYTVILPLGVVSLASRYGNGCVIMSDGSAACWGGNQLGQLGNGTTVDSATSPVAVTGLLDVTAIATGSEHSCASTGNGSLYCWGSNHDGQAGGISTMPSLTPSRVGGLP